MKKSPKLMVFVFILIVILLNACAFARLQSPSPTFTPSVITSTEIILVPTEEPFPTPEPTAVGLVYIPNAEIIYYDIAGSNENELREQLNQLAPVGFDGYKGDANTRWEIRWNWPGYGDSDCDLSAAIVTYTIKITMPRWIPPEDASPELVDKWSTYIVNLAEHEKGHSDFVVENYQTLVDAIKGATCETAEDAAQAVLTTIREHDIRYDADTNHGATQGARFP